jgi:hypothetical protein
MKRLVPNATAITSNYEEITLWEEIIKISNDDTITGENLLTLKTNIEMKLGRKLQKMGFRQRCFLSFPSFATTNPYPRETLQYL